MAAKNAAKFGIWGFATVSKGVRHLKTRNSETSYMMDDDDFLPISALQHLVFCPRQCALNYIEQEWMENLLTARGRLEHERVDTGYKESRRGKRQLSGLAIRSRILQLQGRLDVLELELIDACGADNLSLLGFKGLWRVYPVEFKHGEPKESDCDRIQLCAQALCLEEMFSICIEEASLFYQKIRRREDVQLDDSLRNKTMQTAAELHRLFSSGKTPPPVYSNKCRSCSMIEVCLPKKFGAGKKNYEKLLYTPVEPLP